MKLTRSTYFSFFFLLSFLASFSTAAYKRVHSSVSKSDLQHTYELAYSKHESTTDSDIELLFEETENESENDFEAQNHLLPFFIFHFQYELFPRKLIDFNPLADALANPIYLKVCNFRI